MPFLNACVISWQWHQNVRADARIKCQNSYKHWKAADYVILPLEHHELSSCSVAFQNSFFFPTIENDCAGTCETISFENIPSLRNTEYDLRIPTQRKIRLTCFWKIYGDPIWNVTLFWLKTTKTCVVTLAKREVRGILVLLWVMHQSGTSGDRMQCVCETRTFLKNHVKRTRTYCPQK